MKSTTDRERRWLRQWEEARPALAAQRRVELRRLNEEKALAASEALLSLVSTATLSPSRRCHSGLIEQQSLFHRDRGR